MLIRMYFLLRLLREPQLEFVLFIYLSMASSLSIVVGNAIKRVIALMNLNL